MSRKLNILVIEPTFASFPKSDEVHCFKDMSCQRCNGEGRFYLGGYMEKFKKDLDDPDYETCPDCEGTGKLCANVVVQWKPDKPLID